MWYFNGGQLQGVSGSSYTLTAEKTNEGTYYVQVSDTPANFLNGVTIQSAIARLTVVATLPTITSQPTSPGTVTQGTNVSFNVGASGDALNYQWRFNGNSISGANSNSLRITAAQFADTGFYDVVVTNLLGGVTSAPVSLTVVSLISKTNATVSGQATGVKVVGNYAYVTQGDTNGNGALLIFNGTSPAATNALAGPALGLFVSGSNAFVSCGSNGLDVLDISSSSSPVSIATNAGPALGCFVTNVSGTNYAFVAAGTNGLQVLNVSSPADPVSITNLTAHLTSALSVWVAGTNAYVGDASNGLVIIDVSGPSSPRWVTNCATGAPVLGVQTSGNLAYVAAAGAGFEVFRLTNTLNLTNATGPMLVSSNATSGSANGLVVSGDYVFVADGTNGVLAFDVSSVTNVQLVGSALVGNAQGVDVSGNMVYVATADNGLVVVDASPIVHSAPQIRVQPQDLAVGQGSNAVFSVTAVGTMPLSYQWWSNNTALVAGTNYAFAALSNLSPATYSVVITNFSGGVTSRTAQLTILPCTYAFNAVVVSVAATAATNPVPLYVTNSGSCPWSAFADANSIGSTLQRMGLWVLPRSVIGWMPIPPRTRAKERFWLRTSRKPMCSPLSSWRRRFRNTV